MAWSPARAVRQSPAPVADSSRATRATNSSGSHPPPRERRERPHRRMLEERRDGQGRREALLEPGVGLDQQQRAAAEVEEILRRNRSRRDRERTATPARSTPPSRSAAAIPLRARAPPRLGKGAAVDLAVGRERKRGEPTRMRRGPCTPEAPAEESARSSPSSQGPPSGRRTTYATSRRPPAGVSRASTTFWETAGWRWSAASISASSTRKPWTLICWSGAAQELEVAVRAQAGQIARPVEARLGSRVERALRRSSPRSGPGDSSSLARGRRRRCRARPSSPGGTHRRSGSRR